MVGVLRFLGLAVLAVATTILSLRLLGGRRGWVKGLTAAAIGWGTALFVSLRVNDWEWGADGLAIHLVAIGIPATMAVAVTLDLLARPGSLAFGERAGLIVTPRPFRAIRRRISVLRRYRELVRLCREQGFGPFLSATDACRAHRGSAGRAPEARARAGRRRVRQARADRRDPRRPAAAGHLQRARRVAEPRARRATRSHCPGSRGGTGCGRRRGVRRIRLGAPRRRLDRPDLSGAAALRRVGGGQGAAARHRGDDGTRSRRSRIARQHGPTAHAVRPGSSLRRPARPVRHRPAQGGRLPSRSGCDE